MKATHSNTIQSLSVVLGLVRLEEKYLRLQHLHTAERQSLIEELFELAETELHLAALAELIDAQAQEPEWPAVPPAHMFKGRMAA